MSEYENEEEIDERRYAEFLGSIGNSQTLPDGISDEVLNRKHKWFEDDTGWKLKREPSCIRKWLGYLVNELNFSEKEWRIYAGIARERKDVLELDAWIYVRIRVRKKITEYQKLEDLTREILEYAVIIDFEGLMDEDPSMAGILYDGYFTQVCFNPKLEKAAIAKNLQFTSLHSYLDELLTECIDDHRLIIGYSQREYDVFCDILPDRIEEINSVYLNAIATKWFKNRYPLALKAVAKKKKKEKYHRDRRIGLKDILDFDFVAYEVEPWAKGVKPAKAIRRMINALEKNKDYKSVTGRTKSAWTMMLRYNQLDVEGLHYLLQWILDNQ
ncbi:MAG: hypothetical protein VW498_04245 [Candidatus Thalassarchaeaceae archaeon]